MRRPLVLLALVLCTAPLCAQEALRIEGLQGRVETIGSAERVELLTGLGPRDCPGPGHLEAGSMASARLYWPGRASLITQGRAGLEWRGGASVFLRVFELQHGELEVRRGPLALELPWNWNGSFETGAYRLRSLPGGALEIETVAGNAPRLWWSRGGLIRPVAGPAIGEHALLPPGWSPPIQGERETNAPWSEISWPWGAAPEALHVTVEAEPVVPQPLPPPPPPLPPVQVERLVVDPAPIATEPEPEPEPLPEPPKVEPPAPAPAPAVPPAPVYDPQLWRGLERAEVVLVGSVAIEQREDLAVERTEKGGISLRLRSDATRPAWVLRTNSDLQLAPGTLVMLDEKGALLANLGSIRALALPPGRLAPVDAGFAPRP